MTFEPSLFWEEVFEPDRCERLAEKYERVFEAIEMAPGSRQNRCLREVARRWPGSLREAQSVDPDRLRQRWAQARAGGQSPARPRAWWRARGWAYLPLWAELHGLFADQLAWRRSQPQRPHALADFLDALEPHVRDRWPDDARILELRGGPRLAPTQAQRWLAARVGLSLAELHQCLFDRVGRSGRGPPQTGENSSNRSRELRAQNGRRDEFAR